MGQRLVLELPDEIYGALAETAQRAGSTPENLAIAWLMAVGRHAARDPVEQFIGALPSNVADWAERHDHYLGQALSEELRGGSGAGS
jgi:hypothetical protein